MNRIELPNDILLGEVTEMLREGHQVVIMTKGNSMNPFINGEKDSVNLVRRDSISPGEIVLASIRPGVYVLHRVVSVSDGTVVLHGDGNLTGNEKCRVEDVSGTAFQILKPSGRVVDCLSEKSIGRAAFWNSLPFQVRRYFLAFYRISGLAGPKHNRRNENH